MKLRAFYLILLVALCVSLLPGCSAFAGKTAIGVIETSGSDATSQIVLFDKDLNKVSGFPLAEASLIVFSMILWLTKVFFTQSLKGMHKKKKPERF